MCEKSKGTQTCNLVLLYIWERSQIMALVWPFSVLCVMAGLASRMSFQLRGSALFRIICQFFQRCFEVVNRPCAHLTDKDVKTQGPRTVHGSLEGVLSSHPWLPKFLYLQPLLQAFSLFTGSGLRGGELYLFGDTGSLAEKVSRQLSWWMVTQKMAVWSYSLCTLNVTCRTSLNIRGYKSNALLGISCV